MSPPLPLDGADVPRATYRLQLNAGFRFADAQAVVPYLAALGIGHVYLSPILRSHAGSTHGYDVVDPSRLNPELGDEAGFARFVDVLRGHGLGLLLDIVPNHMGVLEADNPWWLDVLENGPASVHAAAFDIDWAPAQPELHGKVLLPVLGESYGAALEAGRIVPAFDPARSQFMLHYWAHRFPLDLADHAELLRLVPLPEAATAAERAGLAALREACERLPPRDTPEPVQRAARQREVAAAKAALAALHAGSAWAPGWLAACAQVLQGRPGEPASFDRLDALMDRQAWRLAHWRAATDEINYRRFFDINGLAGLRVEEPAVFEAAHARVLEWIGAGRVDGLRIDHPDGMAEPAAYFERLQRRCAEARAARGAPARATYVVAEKILAEDEPWPPSWPVHGDTGYRFANQVQGLFVDARHVDLFDALYTTLVGAPVDFDAELDAAKRTIMAIPLAADLRLLTELAHGLALRHRHTRDLTRNGLHDAIVEFTAAFDVYRSYVAEHGVAPVDRARIEKCAAVARARCRPSQAACVDFVRRLMLEAPDEPDAQRRAAMLRFVRRLQQFTAPVMAKAMEDTVFYRHHRLVSLNDVGGDPRRFGMPVAAFHAANVARRAQTPHTLLASSTHDSKRSEDVRTRLAVLSEMPQRWADALLRWRELARTQWRIASLPALPTPNDEMLLYQTLVGLWPAGALDEAGLAGLRERVAAYMHKAIREAKQLSSWLDGNDDYENAVRRAVEVLLARPEPNPFLSDLRRFVAEIAPFGACNSLALVTLKLTAPGVPDLYQGHEDWAFALVDPDNRRAVDFAALARRLDGVRTLAGDAGAAAALRELPLPDGPHKLFVTWRLLQWRQRAAALFRDGTCEPLDADGPGAEHVVAFARCHAGRCSVTVAPRLAWTLSGGALEALLDGSAWGDTRLRLPPAAAGWHDVLADRALRVAPDADGAPTVRLAELLAGLPVAVLSDGA